MEHLKFCPECGEKTLIWDGEKKLSCSDCNFVLFHNCAAAVAVVIRYKDEIMLTRRNQEPALGKLDLAGGFVDPRESAEQTCARELHEELKLCINVKKLKPLMTLPNIYHYKGIDYNTLDMFFEYEIDEKPSLDLDFSEVSETLWFRKNELGLQDIAFDSQRKFFANYIQS